MGDEFQTVSNQSWFSRLGNALKGIIFGFIFIAGGIGLLFWNEGRAIHRAQTLEMGASQVISINAGTIDQGNDGKLVHLTTEAGTDEILKDPELGISAKAIKLARHVEMYQWKEDSHSKTKKKVGGGTKTVTTYSYEKTWSSSAIDSSDFQQSEGHGNPPMPFRSTSWEAQTVMAGAFQLAPVFTGMVPASDALHLDAAALAGLPEILKNRAHLSSGTFYLGADPAQAQIGDLKISFSETPAQVISLVGLQQGNLLAAYPSQHGSISLLEGGVHSADAMFQSAKTANKTMTWILRGVGILVLLIGFSMLFKPLAVLADVIPIIGSMVGVGTGLVAFFLALTTGIITIAIGWLVYRPLLGITLLVLALGTLSLLLWLLFRHRESNPVKATTPPPPPPPPAS